MLALLGAALLAASARAQAAHTLSDAKLSATIGAAPGAGFAVLSELKIPGHPTVLNPPDSFAGESPLWEAEFLGAGVGTASLNSENAASTEICAATVATAASATAVIFRWVNCKVELPGAPAPAPPPPPPAPPGPKQWVTHPASLCLGKCMPKDSSGPGGGHCDRLPGCGHDAGLPFCEAAALKAHCEAAKGCTCCTTNGYLYEGSTAVSPFTTYNLTSFTLGGSGPPGPPPSPPVTHLVNVTMDVSLADGLLAWELSFQGDGSASLLQYEVGISGIKTAKSTSVVKSTSARQLVGLYDSSADGTADAVYFAAHDPAHVVKTCAGTAATGRMACTTLALDATLPLHEYKSFPHVVTVVQGDWWDITQVYRTWVLPNAHWTTFGPLEARTDLPDWLENITLWMNNNWGGDPLRPNYGGDPVYVQGEMLKVNELLALPSHGGHLGLHWYEWDTLGYTLGSNHTKCASDPGPPCGFDTHYPDYFPARQGCSAAIKAMQKAGMRVIPYINGQLYDTRIARWTQDHANISNQKFLIAGKETMATATTVVPLSPHLEHFDGITSAVM